MIDDTWIDIEIEQPPAPEPPRRRRRAPWPAFVLGLLTTGAIVALVWAAISFLGAGVRDITAVVTTAGDSGPTTSSPAPDTTTTIARTRTPQESLWDRALAEAAAAAGIVADDVTAASRVWEEGAADFPTTRARFGAAAEEAAGARSALAAALVPDGTDPALVSTLLEAFDDLSIAASDAVLGLESSDDGSLRREAVGRTTAVTADIELLVADLRAALPEPEPGEEIARPTALGPSQVLARDGSLLGSITDGGLVADDSPFPRVTAAAIALAFETGALGDDPASRLTAGGVVIETGIDPGLQVHAERVLERWFDGDPSTPKAAVAVVDIESGAVTALAERRPDGDTDDHYALHRRRPGSVFKVYGFLAAVERGIDPDAPRDASTPVTLSTDGGPWSCFDPAPDADGSASLRESIVASLNTVYCRLAVELGADRIVEVAQRTGISSPVVAIPSVVLGSEKVTPLEMAGSFATIARGGARIDPWLVRRITIDGAVAFEHRDSLQRALDPAVAATTVEALTGVVENGTGTLADIGRPQAGKTGSPIEGTDAWFVGFTARTSAAVWVGSVDPDQPMGRSTLDGREYPMVYGGPVAAPIWAEIVAEAEQGFAPAPLG